MLDAREVDRKSIALSVEIVRAIKGSEPPVILAALTTAMGISIASMVVNDDEQVVDQILEGIAMKTRGIVARLRREPRQVN